MRIFGDLATTLTASSEMSIVFKATVALVLGLVASRLARRARASVRHLMLAATFVVLLALPTAGVLLPSIAIAVPASRAIAAPPSSTQLTASAIERQQSASTLPAAPRSGPPVSRITVLRTAWGLGTAVLFLSLAIALWRLRQMRQRGLPWIEASKLVATLATDAGVLRRVEVLVHEGAVAPMTCGILRPVVVLPADVREWSEPSLRRALVHELEHVRRRDWWMHVVARAVCAAYWFHPLVWIAYRQLCLEAERACDDAVVVREEGHQYAEQLVSLARRMAERAAQPAIGMAYRSDLSARISAVLDATQPRGRTGLIRGSVVVALSAGLVLALAPMRLVGATSAASDLAGAEGSERGAQRRGRVARLDRALVEAVDNGDLRDVADLLDAGANVNATIDGDGSPLIVAAREGQVAIVTLLLDRGAEPNLAVPGDGNPLIMAAREGHLQIVELLLNRGASVDQVVPADENALIQASGGGHLDVVKLLVSRGADVNARVWAEEAYERRQGEWRTPLSMARRGRHGAVVAFLLSVGAAQ